MELVVLTLVLFEEFVTYCCVCVMLLLLIDVMFVALPYTD